MIAYVAGPYSGNIDGNIRVAKVVSILLWEMGYTVFCAHLNEAHFEDDSKCTWDDFMRGNLEIMLECDVVVMLPRWQESHGARLERQYALKRGIPVCAWPNVPVPTMKRIDFDLTEET